MRHDTLVELIRGLRDANGDGGFDWVLEPAQAEFAKRLGGWRTWQSERGSRYAECTFDNFVPTNDKQRHVLRRCVEYGHVIRDNIAAGVGFVLFGPRGTGKDHLLTAMVREAFKAGLEVTWRNGMEFYAEMRDAISDDSDGGRRSIKSLKSAQVLAISDPLPPTGSLTEFQQQTLFRIVDYRYSHGKATWITMNVSGRTELDQRLGAPTADRLVDGALSLFCNWPSYRKPVDE